MAYSANMHSASDAQRSDQIVLAGAWADWRCR